MARPENGFQLLVNRLKAFGNADQIVEILYSPEMDTDLRADRFSEWADLEPENEFVGRCAARTLVAAGIKRLIYICSNGCYGTAPARSPMPLCPRFTYI